MVLFRAKPVCGGRATQSEQKNNAESEGRTHLIQNDFCDKQERNDTTIEKSQYRRKKNEKAVGKKVLTHLHTTTHLSSQ